MSFTTEAIENINNAINNADIRSLKALLELNHSEGASYGVAFSKGKAKTSSEFTFSDPTLAGNFLESLHVQGKAFTLKYLTTVLEGVETSIYGEKPAPKPKAPRKKKATEVVENDSESS